MNSVDQIRRVDELTQDNVLRVFDVTFDIHKQLNIEQGMTVQIAAAPQAVKHLQLLPNRTIPALGEYESGRQQACAFLKEIGIIVSYRLINEDAQRVRRQIEVDVANGTELNEVLNRLHARLVSKMTHESTATTKRTLDSEVEKLLLDISNPEPYLRYKERKQDLNSTSIEYFVLKELFEEFPNPALDDNIVEAWGRTDKPQTLYDASRRINEKLMKLLEVEGAVLVHKNSKFWFDEQYKQLIEPLTKPDQT